MPFVRLANMLGDVSRYMEYVVSFGVYLYGDTYPSINVHTLLHLIEDYQVKMLNKKITTFCTIFSVN